MTLQKTYSLKIISRLAILILLLLLPIISIGSYICGYNNAKDKTTNEFLDKKVNLAGAYFDNDDNLKINTFSCTPNNLDGDCSSQIIDNYKFVSRHWLDFCQKELDKAYQNGWDLYNGTRNNTPLNIFPLPLQNPTAYCNDGTTSYSQNHSGTCSNHGGVYKWN